MRAVKRYSKRASELLEEGRQDEAVDLLINKANMTGAEVSSWVVRKAAPVLTESQIRKFVIKAEALEILRFQHQLEVLQNEK